ncbi:MAG: hypothetical protein JWL57_3874, partial [Actinobacteria bacterium]|nr:hypothetical protein [Actinomycetota bacterium]
PRRVSPEVCSSTMLVSLSLRPSSVSSNWKSTAQTWLGCSARRPEASQLLERVRASGEANVDADLVQLPVGLAVRLLRRVTIPLPSHDVRAEACSVQYFVPTVGDIVTLSFATPNVGFETAFGELFRAIAETLRWR